MGQPQGKFETQDEEGLRVACMMSAAVGRTREKGTVRAEVNHVAATKLSSVCMSTLPAKGPCNSLTVIRESSVVIEKCTFKAPNDEDTED